jgi:hypothetical protein
MYVCRVPEARLSSAIASQISQFALRCKSILAGGGDVLKKSKLFGGAVEE